MMTTVACSNTEPLLPVTATEISTPTQLVERTPISSPTPVKTEPITLFIDDHGVPMALVPAGSFEMGNSGGADEYEVTNSQYAICLDAGVCDPTTDTTAFESSYSRRIYYGNAEYADYPVIYANWYEAQKYCGWRGARLPTEA